MVLFRGRSFAIVKTKHVIKSEEEKKQHCAKVAPKFRQKNAADFCPHLDDKARITQDPLHDGHLIKLCTKVISHS